MMKNILDFDEFINEEINFEHTDDKCFLTRPWYYYNNDDDIVYGSDVAPSGEYNVIFENKDDAGVRMISIDLNTGEQYNCVGTEEVIGRINEMFGEDINLDNTERIQELFDNDNDSRYILLDGKQMLASSFDVIEEN